MKNIISYLGRVSIILLVVIGFEGIVTLGNAFEFDSYTFISWLTQFLIFIVCLWIADMWQENSNLDI